MRKYKESEWREEVEDLEGLMYTDPYNQSLEGVTLYALKNATTRGAVLYFHFSLPVDFNTDVDHIMSIRRKLKEIRRKRRGERGYKRYLWRKSLKAKIYRWLLKCEYKRITKHDKPNNTIEQ
ncbi:MAG: hypothetical protein PUG74_08750 [Prevotellaceae bacterium]|nr:hypothetical protein [Prevotellaceae bacterium]